ncbi:MAG: hypothetical protein DMF90_03320 [Acidobacteria bacterium]|nr:MAG: hypothetical protein DMF90_03320 [Acidobacteriota bacterium]
MLRITTTTDGARLRVRLEGRLVAAWVTEAERAWRGAYVAGSPFEVDLTGVTSIDGDGWTLLAAMKGAGALFVAEGVGMKQLIEEMLDGSSKRTQAPPLRLTLKEAVGLALRQNPQVATAILSLAERQSEHDVARAALLPQVSIGASEFVTRANVESLFGSAIPGFSQHIGPFWTVQAGARFSVPVFDLALWRRWQASRESVHTGEAERDVVREQNAQLVVSQYLGGLRAAADVTAAKSRLQLAEALFALASDLKKSGVGTSLDAAYRARPEMRALEAQTRAAELEKGAARADEGPRVAIGGGWRLKGLTSSTAIPVYQYGASVEMPVLTGGRNRARMAIADIQLKKLSESTLAVRNQIAQEVKSASALLSAARVEVDAANLGVTLAQQAVTQAQDRFRAGVANNIEVISAQDQLARANDNQITALYRYNHSRADLARATGQMEALYAR